MPPIKMKIFGTATMNEKGQIVIPAEARAELGLEPGARLMAMKGPFGNGLIIVKTETVEAQMKSWAEALSSTEADNSSGAML